MAVAARLREPLLLLCVTLMCLAAFAAAASDPPGATADPLDDEFGDTGLCKSKCRLRYGRSGPAQEAFLVGCYRGCRLFSICHFVIGGANAKLNTTRYECGQACFQVFNKAEEQHGCVTGCRNQHPLAGKHKDKTFEIRPPSSSSVFDVVSSFFSDLVSSAQSFISSTWTFYLQADDGKVVVFQSQPEIEYPVAEVQAPKADVTEKAWLPSRFNTLKPHPGVPQKLDKTSSKDIKPKHKPQHLESSQQEHDFLGCMSKRSGLPRWILAACLFLSIMVMLWLGCASLVTAPDQHVKTQSMSINGDKEYLDLEKSTPFSLEPVIAVTICPTIETEEAGPLPVKVDLDKTII